MLKIRRFRELGARRQYVECEDDLMREDLRERSQKVERVMEELENMMRNELP